MSGLFCGGLRPTEKAVQGFIESRLPNFIYKGGYEGSDSYVALECRVCGVQTRKNMRTIRKANYYTNLCPNCESVKKIKEQQAEVDAKRAEKEAKRAEEAAIREAKKRREPVACKYCGSFFVPSTRKSYCSSECARKVENNHKDRRLRGQPDKDWNITVPALVVRDNNTCYLCGGKCDSTDFRITDAGHFIAGPHYPSIDHVLPIAKGGKNRWDNVRLAHLCCNMKKRDKVLECEPPPSEKF